ncbi:alpha/beta hydrolase domain-containing protein [Solirubrobacter soli]|uniref:alpha/beta hydrolase domain-containing protein n=1 Tax=Solirubrobacter soli TaxID=363832 RepID=UPI0003FD8561|nr:alpha/beta hydrolase domain-containing protein [Solirubrobacter soli]
MFAAVALAATLSIAGAAQAAIVPSPAISGPVKTPRSLDGTHGIPYTSSSVDLRSHGYTEQEFFVSGTARAYAPVGTLGSEGRWQVKPSTTAPYKTRIIVRRPIDMSRFNGTVVFEWMNATTGRDLDVGWIFGHNELLKSGSIYVGVTAQAITVTSPTGLIAWDPDRYGTLTHPGDQYSYDIFSQVAQGVLNGRKVDPLAGGHPRETVAYGDSQSASRLVTYADAIQPRDQLFDALLIHSRSAGGADLAPGIPVPSPTLIRADVPAKVLTLESESDVVRNGQPRYVLARQANSDSFRLWEAAGTSHFNAEEEALMRIQAFREWPFANPPLQYNTCPEQMNDVHVSDLVDTAFDAIGRWIVNGRKPATPPLLQVQTNGTATDYVRNELGITKGGVRLPQIVVPTGAQKGEGNTGVGTCTLAGNKQPYDAATLASLYPTHDIYVRKFTRAVNDAVSDGWIQPYDVGPLVDEAEESAIPALSNVP